MRLAYFYFKLIITLMGICGVGCSGDVVGEALPGSDELKYPQYRIQPP